VAAAPAFYTPSPGSRAPALKVLVVRAVAPLLYLGGDFYVTLDPDTLNHVGPE